MQYIPPRQSDWKSYVIARKLYIEHIRRMPQKYQLITWLQDLTDYRRVSQIEEATNVVAYKS